MKKLLLVLLLASLSLSLVACGGNNADVSALEKQVTELQERTQDIEVVLYEVLEYLGIDEEDELIDETTENVADKNTSKPIKKDTYALNEWWEIPGQWKLKVDSVKATSDRNEYSEKKPTKVFIIKYTYENLGYESKSQDLFITPEGVIGDDRKMGYGYPASTNYSPKPTPIGAICEGAEDAWAVDNDSKTIKILFESYDNNSNKQKATFEVPITE